MLFSFSLYIISRQFGLQKRKAPRYICLSLWSLYKQTVLSFLYCDLSFQQISFESITDQFPTANSAAETPGGAESPDRVSRVMSVTSEPKVPHTPSAESPTKSREAPVPRHTTSGKRLDLLQTVFKLYIFGMTHIYYHQFCFRRNHLSNRCASVPTLPDYPGVFQIQTKSCALPYGSPNLQAI